MRKQYPRRDLHRLRFETLPGCLRPGPCAIAQLVEQVTVNYPVPGSSPGRAALTPEKPMTIIATIQLDEMPNDADLAEIERVIRTQLCEWLDFDRCPENLHVTLERRRPCPLS